MKTDLSVPTKEDPTGSTPKAAVDDEMDRNIAASVLLLMSEKPQEQISVSGRCTCNDVQVSIVL